MMPTYVPSQGRVSKLPSSSNQIPNNNMRSGNFNNQGRNAVPYMNNVSGGFDAVRQHGNNSSQQPYNVAGYSNNIPATVSPIVHVPQQVHTQHQSQMNNHNQPQMNNQQLQIPQQQPLPQQPLQQNTMMNSTVPLSTNNSNVSSTQNSPNQMNGINPIPNQVPIIPNQNQVPIIPNQQKNHSALHNFNISNMIQQQHQMNMNRNQQPLQHNQQIQPLQQNTNSQNNQVQSMEMIYNTQQNPFLTSKTNIVSPINNSVPINNSTATNNSIPTNNTIPHNNVAPRTNPSIKTNKDRRFKKIIETEAPIPKQIDNPSVIISDFKDRKSKVPISYLKSKNRKLVLQSPFFKIISIEKTSDPKFFKFTLVIHSENKESKEWLDWVTELEKYVENKISANFQKWFNNSQSTITCYEFIKKNINIQPSFVSDNNIIKAGKIKAKYGHIIFVSNELEIVDEYGNQMKIEDISMNHDISAILEFQSIWIDSTTPNNSYELIVVPHSLMVRESHYLSLYSPQVKYGFNKQCSNNSCDNEEDPLIKLLIDSHSKGKKVVQIDNEWKKEQDTILYDQSSLNPVECYFSDEEQLEDYINNDIDDDIDTYDPDNYVKHSDEKINQQLENFESSLHASNKEFFEETSNSVKAVLIESTQIFNEEMQEFEKEAEELITQCRLGAEKKAQIGIKLFPTVISSEFPNLLSEFSERMGLRKQNKVKVQEINDDESSTPIVNSNPTSIPTSQNDNSEVNENNSETFHEIEDNDDNDNNDNSDIKHSPVLEITNSTNNGNETSLLSSEYDVLSKLEHDIDLN